MKRRHDQSRCNNYEASISHSATRSPSHRVTRRRRPRPSPSPSPAPSPSPSRSPTPPSPAPSSPSRAPSSNATVANSAANSAASRAASRAASPASSSSVSSGLATSTSSQASAASVASPSHGPPSASAGGFGVLYWANPGEDGWDLVQRGQAPRLCTRCNGVADAWRGRFENAQVTLRACMLGRAFRSYVKAFLMLSARSMVYFDLPAFNASRDVLTERAVLGTILRARDDPSAGVYVEHSPSAWLGGVRGLAAQLCGEAHANNSAFAVLLLDARGRELRAAEMVRVHQQRTQRRRPPMEIGRLMVLVGGPSGIHASDEHQLERVLEEVSDSPLLRCSLPGGLMHSSFALASLFVLHDQGVLLPFLSHLAEEKIRSRRGPPVVPGMPPGQWFPPPYH